MSDTHDHAHPAAEPEEGAHEGPIRTPKQLIAAVVASFLIPIGVIVLLVNYVDFGERRGAGSDGLSAEAVARRLQRVGSIELRDASVPAVLRTGEQVYQGQCQACHTSGAAGAPKLGDEAAWAPRMRTGYDALLTSALKGKGAMAPQSGGEYSDVEIGRAVVYLANKAGGKFEEPKPPQAAASGAGEIAAGAGAAASGGAAGSPAAPVGGATQATTSPTGNTVGTPGPGVGSTGAPVGAGATSPKR